MLRFDWACWSQHACGLVTPPSLWHEESLAQHAAASTSAALPQLRLKVDLKKAKTANEARIFL
jgi:hypothetical protein